MSVAARVFHVLLRIGEFISSVIVLGLIGRVLYMVGQADASTDSRLIYTTVIASISTIFSIIFVLPFLYAFLAFPMDFIMFVTWLVAFCLMEALTGIHTCDAFWYWNYWGFYWGGIWRRNIVVHGPADINWVGCSSWKSVLAFSFIVSMTYLLSSCLGAYECLKYREVKRGRLAQLHTSPGLITKEAPPADPEARDVRDGASQVNNELTAPGLPQQEPLGAY
ncbi:uncharacterized protein PAC_18742 [Phialocephala subalpina]|uniref:MARVEL domain-containing protein n=1 Tax=Phialocephala subalpina TaxID=576137 RepID=A0A1L7XUY0_9HELO|nr:uncharacterized protein PAC_18742 [Phialocephala subalpina]